MGCICYWLCACDVCVCVCVCVCTCVWPCVCVEVAYIYVHVTQITATMPLTVDAPSPLHQELKRQGDVWNKLYTLKCVPGTGSYGEVLVVRIHFN